MTQTVDNPSTPALSTEHGTEHAVPRPLWRVAGVLAITHVVLLFAGFSQEKSVELTDGPGDVARTFGGGSIARIFAGGYVESVSFLVLLPALVFLARAVGRRTEAGRWAAQTGLAAGLTYVAITLATAMPAGAAAVYGAQHHLAGAGTLAVVDDVRTFAFYLSLAALGVHAIATGVAALSDGVMRRWLGWGGIVTGVLLLLGMPVQRWFDGVNISSMVWMVWWVGVGVSLIRRGTPARAR
jgi:uncharacterized protein DUF4386